MDVEPGMGGAGSQFCNPAVGPMYPVISLSLESESIDLTFEFSNPLSF